MNFMQFCHQKGNISTLNLRFAYFVRSKMSVKGIIMFLGMNSTRLERKILIILDFENGFLPTYLPLCGCSNGKHTNNSKPNKMEQGRMPIAEISSVHKVSKFPRFYPYKKVMLKRGNFETLYKPFSS